MQFATEQIKNRIRRIIQSRDVDGGFESWQSFCTDLWRDETSFGTSKASMFTPYKIIFKILSGLTNEQLQDSGITKELISTFTNDPLHLNQEHAKSCIEYAKNKILSKDDYMLYLNKEYNLLINELSEFSIYSEELKSLCNELKSLGDNFLVNIKPDQNNQESLQENFIQSFQNATQKLYTLDNSACSLRKKVISILRRIYALILSLGSQEKYERHKEAFWLSDSDIESRIKQRLTSFFLIPKPNIAEPKPLDHKHYI